MTKVQAFPARCSARRAVWFAAVLLCLAAQVAGAGDLAEVKARGKLIMLCYPTQNSTFVSADLDAMRENKLTLAEMRNPDQFNGLDVELMKGFAKSLGVDLEIRAITGGYDSLLPALVRREGDLVASSLTSTPKREETAAFSEPYLTSWVAVAVPASSKISSLTDLAGKKAAVMHGSSQLEYLQSMAPDAQLLLTDFSLENYLAVKEGEADFTLLDTRAAVGESVSSSYPDLKVAFRLREFGYRVAFRKGSDLLESFNAYLAGLGQSGDLERLAARHDSLAGGGKAAPEKP